VVAAAAAAAVLVFGVAVALRTSRGGPFLVALCTVRVTPRALFISLPLVLLLSLLLILLARAPFVHHAEPRFLLHP
jgi:hypothetical protein